jgi:hypothetical protein
MIFTIFPIGNPPEMGELIQGISLYSCFGLFWVVSPRKCPKAIGFSEDLTMIFFINQGV